MVEKDRVEVRRLLFFKVGGLCDLLSPAMMATCRKPLGQQRSAELLNVFERCLGGSRKEIGFTKQIDHKQIELGELKTSFLSGAWGEAEKR